MKYSTVVLQESTVAENLLQESRIILTPDVRLMAKRWGFFKSLLAFSPLFVSIPLLAVWKHRGQHLVVFFSMSSS